MVKPGYKQTEVGMIPEDWECVQLLEKARLLNGLTYTPENVKEYGLLVLRSSNVQNSKLSFEDTLFVDCVVSDEKKIKEGDIIALENGKLTVTDKSIEKALYKLAKKMIDKDKSFVTLISGSDVSEEDAQAAYEMLCDKFSDDVDVTFVNGGQPVYYYILSVE